MKYNLIYIVVIICTLISCKTETEKVPEDLIDKEVMIDVITEIELTQAVVKLKFSTKEAINSQKLYNQVFDSFSISEDQFNSSLAYYCKNPKETEKLYSEAIERLSEKQAEQKN